MLLVILNVESMGQLQLLHQHKGGGKTEQAIGARDGHHAIFQGLAQRLQIARTKLWQFVKK